MIRPEVKERSGLADQTPVAGIKKRRVGRANAPPAPLRTLNRETGEGIRHYGRLARALRPARIELATGGRKVSHPTTRSPAPGRAAGPTT